MLDWQDMLNFVALAEAGTLSGAARRLRVEHATVARRVAALEGSVGAKLVDRRSGRYVLTAMGETVAAHGRRMQAEAFAMERAVLGGSGEARPVSVSVSAPPVIASHLIAPGIAAFRRAEPRISLQLLGESRQVSLARGEADVALRLARPADRSLVVRRLRTITYRLYCSRAYARRHTPATADYLGLGAELDSAPNQSWLERQAGDRPIVFRANDLAALTAAAAAGAGIAALPDFLGTAAKLAVVGEQAFDRALWLTYHRELRGTPAIVAVVAFLADCLKAPVS